MRTGTPRIKPDLTADTQALGLALHPFWSLSSPGVGELAEPLPALHRPGVCFPLLAKGGMAAWPVLLGFGGRPGLVGGKK
jgi:hypothetical protein